MNTAQVINDIIEPYLFTYQQDNTYSIDTIEACFQDIIYGDNNIIRVTPPCFYDTPVNHWWNIIVEDYSDSLSIKNDNVDNDKEDNSIIIYHYLDHLHKYFKVYYIDIDIFYKAFFKLVERGIA